MNQPTARDTGETIDVSVIIAAWKAAGFIERAVASALASTGVRVEVIVVDDASPDNTFEIARQLGKLDDRIIADRLPANSGPSAARNRAIELSTGRYLAVLDADDAMTLGRLAALVTLADRTNADIAVDNMLEVDDAGAPGPGRLFLKSDTFTRSSYINLATWVQYNQPMRPGDCLGYLKPLIRRATLARTELNYDPSLRNSEDYYLIANLLAAGARMIYTPESGYYYQRSASSTSHRLTPEQTHAWLDAEKRFRDSYSRQATPEEKAALITRGRVLRNVDQLVSAIEAVKGRRIGKFVSLLAANPGASPYTVSTLAKIAMGKALRRKLV